MSFTEHSFKSENGHTLVYSDWGDKDANPIICVHGLTGNGFDFDFLADDLIQNDHRVIAIDLPGRGRSDFLDDPMGYNHDQYTADLYALLDHLGLESVDWIGISLGGLLGMRIAGKDNSPIKKLIVNDVGPTVPQAALDYIYEVIKVEYSFRDVEELEQRMRATRGLTWGPLEDIHWKHMAKHNYRVRKDGLLSYAYDPEIARMFEKEPIGDVDLWSRWKAIDCPALVIHGADSVLLTQEIIDQMREHGPDFDLVTFQGCGHVPSLMTADQIEVVRTWLSAT